jgi:hypothetical protein
MSKEYTYTTTGKDIRVKLMMAVEMVLAKCTILMVMYMKESGLMENEKEMERLCMLVELMKNILVSGRMICVMVMVNIIVELKLLLMGNGMITILSWVKYKWNNIMDNGKTMVHME